MRIRDKFLLPIIGILIVSSTAGGIASFTAFKGIVGTFGDKTGEMHESWLVDLLQSKGRQVDLEIGKVGTKALGIASLFSRWETVEEAYRIALSGNIDDERDPAAQRAREMLRYRFENILRGYAVEEGAEGRLRLHFHLPNGRSLVRLWRDGYQTVRDGRKLDISDDISDFRKTILKINREDHSPITGIEIGRGGFVIRGITPVTAADGAHLGSAEVLFRFNEAITSVLTDDHIHYAVFYMNADRLRIAEALKDPVRFPVIGGRYVLTDRTDLGVAESLGTPERLDRGKQSATVERAGDFMAGVSPIRDFSGETVGVLLLAFDASAQQAALSRFVAMMMARVSRFQWEFSAGVIVLLLIISAAVFYTASRVTRPFGTASETLDRLARGDLTTRINRYANDEFGELMKLMDTVSENLRNMVRELQWSAARVAANGGRVNASAASLASGVSEQAASVEEISASVEEMSATIKQNARQADETRRMIHQAAEKAEEGERALVRTIEALDAIVRRSNVIDAFAGRTDLLAINASVEAARARRDGLGFSALAAEIRKLAESSRSAAREIEATSVESREIAGAARSIYSGLLTDVTRLAEMVESVSAASQEQSLGITQIEQGILQIDQVLQENATASNAIAAATEALDADAGRMKVLASRFITEDRSAYIASASEPPATPKAHAAPSAGIDYLTKTPAPEDIPGRDIPERDIPEREIHRRIAEIEGLFQELRQRAGGNNDPYNANRRQPSEEEADWQRYSR